MTNQPLVSVLIPSYNHEKFIQKAIKSVINQTYENLELIIVDDGSSDLTFQKMNEMKEECERRFKRVHFETKENEGVCATVNRLIELAKGEYFYEMASDDLAKENIVEKEVNFLINNPKYAVAVGNSEFINMEDKIAYWDENKNLVYDKNKAKYLTFVDFLKTQRPYIDFNSEEFGTYSSFTFGNYIPNGFTVRKEVFEKIGKYTKEAPLEDLWFMLQVSKYYKIKYLDEILFQYRCHETNNISNTEKMYTMFKKVVEYEKNVLKNINPNEVLPSVKEFLKDGYCNKIKGKKGIFEIMTYKNYEYKFKVLKIFNVKVLKLKTKLIKF